MNNLPTLIKFRPVFKEVIWGGKRIAEFKGIPSQGDHVGESWELSPMPGRESIAEGGPFAGRTLNEIVEEYPNEVLGSRAVSRFGARFPLLVKFIDSADDLSIQVHPDDMLAMRRHGSLGKSEMWLSLRPAEGAYLYAGFNRKLTPEEFRKAVKENTIIGDLKKFYTREGDTFFLPAGRVHSIGKGNFVLEIQEASDLTYRIYDYDRRDAEGNPRALHVEESIDAIDFHDLDMRAGHVWPEAGKSEVMTSTQHFKASLLEIAEPTKIALPTGQSFTILIVVKGNAEVEGADGEKHLLTCGTTVLVPAATEQLTAAPTDGRAQIVTVEI